MTSEMDDNPYVENPPTVTICGKEVTIKPGRMLDMIAEIEKAAGIKSSRTVLSELLGPSVGPVPNMEIDG